MRAKLIFSLLVVAVIIVAGVVWLIRSSRDNVSRPFIATVSQTQNHALIALPFKPAPKDDVSHFYSPLRDPPPAPTLDQLKRWKEELAATLNKGMVPNLSGPPLVSIYKQEAAKANSGDIQAAVTLFRGLFYCTYNTLATLATKAQLDSTILQMQENQTDRSGVPTSNVAAAVEHVREQYQYCAGISMKDRSEINHWAGLAVQSNDPYIQADAALGLTFQDAGVTTYPQLLSMQHDIVNSAAQAGVPVAWKYKWMWYSANGDLTDAYASLYTEYMLTRSPYLAYQIWQQSLQLNPLQIQEAESLANQNYKVIKSSN